MKKLDKRYVKWIILGTVIVGYGVYLNAPLFLSSDSDYSSPEPVNNVALSSNVQQTTTGDAEVATIKVTPPPKKIAPQVIMLSASSNEIILKSNQLNMAKMDAEIRGFNTQNMTQLPPVNSMPYIDSSYMPAQDMPAQELPTQDINVASVSQNVVKQNSEVIHLNGIMSNNGKRTAFLSVNGSSAFPIMEGETINAIRVLKITNKSVVINQNGHKKVLRKDYE